VSDFCYAQVAEAVAARAEWRRHTRGTMSRMRNKSASGVLAALKGSPHGVSTIRLFACCGLAGRPCCASWAWLPKWRGTGV